VAAAAALAAIGSGCAGPELRWTAAPGQPGRLLAIPANAPVVGLGVEPSPRGLLPRRCLAGAERVVQGGEFSLSVQPVEGPLQSGDEDLDAFVEDGAKRAAQARPAPDGPALVAALLVVRTRGQWTSLKDETATLTGEAKRLLADGERGWSFFERCGTHFVQAVRREPSAVAYLALYPANAAQRDEWTGLVAGWASAAPGDLARLQVLDRLASGAPWYLAVRADADAAFEVVEPGRPGEGTGTLLGHALRATFGTDRGRIAEVSVKPWSSLPAALTLLKDAREPLRTEPERRERLHQRLKLLEWRALDRETLLAKAAEAGAGECRASLARALAPFSWDAYYRCRSAAREMLPISLEAVEACRPVLAALDTDALPAPCVPLALDNRHASDPLKRIDTRYPMLLELGPGADHLSMDAVQLAQVAPPVPLKSACLEGGPGGEAPMPLPPPPPSPWSQDDWDARAFREPPPPKPVPPPPPSPPPEGEAGQGPICIDAPGGQGGGQGGKPLCLHARGEEAPAPGASRPAAAAPGLPQGAPGGSGEPREVVLDVSSNRRPDGERRWPWWKRLLGPLFWGWKGPDPPRPIYREAYEMRTLRENAREEPRLTEKALELARKDLPAFYRACGTHRVTQVVERKGISSHYSPGSLYDREVTVLPYGVARMSAGGDAFRPATVQDFLGGRASWLGALSEPSDGIPQELVLEPWSELLLESGVVQPHQLSPLTPEPRR
jgi:hypothetical protein